MTMIIPPNARTAEVRISLRRFFGVYNDGYVDKVSLYLEHLECIDPVMDPCAP